MSTESEPNKRIFDKTNPQDIWGPTLQVQREGEELTPDQQRALDIRDLCIVVTDNIFRLRENPSIKTNAFMEADALLMLNQGISRIRELGVTPTARVNEEELDTPLKLAEYVAGQLLLIDINDIPNIHQEKNPTPTHFIGTAYWYLYDMSIKPIDGEEQEFELDEETIWDESARLYDKLTIIIAKDSDLMSQIPEGYLELVIRGDVEMDYDFQIQKSYAKKNGNGSLMLVVGAAGIEIAEFGKNEEYLGSAFVLGPGKTDGYIGFIEDNVDDEHMNTDYALREVERVVNAFG